MAALVQCGLLSGDGAVVRRPSSFGSSGRWRLAFRIGLGPTRVGGRFGWLQPPADGIKLLCKEDIIPAAADRPLFRIAPYVSFCAVFCGFLALPFADGWVAWQLNIARVLHSGRDGPGSVRRDPGRLRLGIEMVAIRGDARGGPSGQLRNPAGAVRAGARADRRHDGPGRNRQPAGRLVLQLEHLHDPFTFVTFCVYCTCAVASTNRAPFDLPEAESELVAGFMTEYSGFRWVVFFMAEYAAIFAVCGLGAILFLGGWNGPVPVASWLGFDARPRRPVAGWVGNLLGMCNFIAKAMIGGTCMIWLAGRCRGCGSIR